MDGPTVWVVTNKTSKTRVWVPSKVPPREKKIRLNHFPAMQSQMFFPNKFTLGKKYRSGDFQPHLIEFWLFFVCWLNLQFKKFYDACDKSLLLALLLLLQATMHYVVVLVVKHSPGLKLTMGVSFRKDHSSTKIVKSSTST